MKNKNLRKRAIMILALSLLLTIFTGCEDSDYEKATKLIEEGEYNEAIEILETIPEHEYSKEVFQKEEVYQEGIKYISSRQYKKAIEVLKEIQGYRDVDILIPKIQTLENNKINEQKLVEQALEVYEQATYNDISHANKIKEIIGDYTKYTGYQKNTDIAKWLVTYADLILHESKSSNPSAEANSNSEYRKEVLRIVSGVTKKETQNTFHYSNLGYSIRTLVLVDFGIIEEEWIMANNNSEESWKMRAEARNDPYIDMSREKLLVSSWGEPSDINTTVTSSKTYEQFCYPDYKYVYVENGEVTTIQY